VTCPAAVCFASNSELIAERAACAFLGSVGYCGLPRQPTLLAVASRYVIAASCIVIRGAFICTVVPACSRSTTFVS